MLLNHYKTSYFQEIYAQSNVVSISTPPLLQATSGDVVTVNCKQTASNILKRPQKLRN